MKKKVMIFTGSYLPGVKGGGPIQSIKNLTDNLSDVFDFYIITSDRDLGDTKPYSNIEINEWNEVNSSKVCYLSKDKITFRNIKKLIKLVSPDTIYLNSFFSYNYSIVPIVLNKFNLINVNKIVLAPRGEFSDGALGLKSFKKKLYMSIVKYFRIYDKENVTWQLTSSDEKKDLGKELGQVKNLSVCQNFSANYTDKDYTKNILKNKNELKLIFLGRIHPMKNLNYAINLLHSLNRGKIILDIYGPIEDLKYWEKCKKNIQKLPPNVEVSYKGLIEHKIVLNTFGNYHYFLFPTHGENFGHVISESLISGTPVIISDQTPWRNLINIQVGWDIALEDKSKFIDILNEALLIEKDDYYIQSRNAFEYAKKMSQQKEKKIKMRQILS